MSTLNVPEKHIIHFLAEEYSMKQKQHIFILNKLQIYVIWGEDLTVPTKSLVVTGAGRSKIKIWTANYW